MSAEITVATLGVVVAAIGTAIAAIVGWRSVQLSEKLLKEAKQTRLSSVRPILFVNMKDEPEPELRIANAGINPASDVYVKPDTRVQLRDGGLLSEHRLLQHGFAIIPPGHELTIALSDDFAFDQYFQAHIEAGRLTDDYVGTLEYRDALTGERYVESYRLGNVPDRFGFRVRKLAQP